MNTEAELVAELKVTPAMRDSIALNVISEKIIDCVRLVNGAPVRVLGEQLQVDDTTMQELFNLIRDYDKGKGN